MRNNNEPSFWPVILIALLLGTIFTTFISSSVSTSRTTFDPAPDRSSREYRYAKERVKLEGYSDRDSATAADAILKFHNAQKARNQ